MPFIGYVALILVSLGGILFELNWLTSPKLETKPAVQASATAPKVAVATVAPAEEVTPAPRTDAPRNVAPTVTMVPGTMAAPKAAQTPSAEPVPAAPQQQVATAPVAATPLVPVINPLLGAANATGSSAATSSATETAGAGSTDFKREFTTEAKTAAPVSTATVAPAANPVTATPAVSMSANNKCDVTACSASYQSFRASDCTYQPVDGSARKVCARGSDGAQQAAAPVRERKIEAAVRKPNRSDDLRSFEREVRRITASEAALDTEPRYGRVILMERGW